MKKNLNLRAIIALGLIFAFLANVLGPIPLVQADEFHLPAPGVRVVLSPEFNPPILKGIKVHPDKPFRFDFILDRGDSPATAGPLKQESIKLVKYFLASLTIPEKDLWVNLSPYEKNRIVPDSFGRTEMGRDLLAEDYMLKQITASLIYPESEIGKRFWKRVYEEAYRKFGTTNIPVNTFNKVWIVPEKAVVYENTRAGTVYVVESKLKVMLEEDYLSLKKHDVPQNSVNALGSKIVREIVIPELTKEVNEDKNFSQLRQIYNSLILATWYKKKIKDSILQQVYANKNKIQGLVIPVKAGGRNKNNVQYIYQQYLQAFKKGVYNYIKEEQDPMTQEKVPRKYFSGGVDFLGDLAMKTTLNQDFVNGQHGLEMLTVDADPLPRRGQDRAMIGILGNKENIVTKLKEAGIANAQVDDRFVAVVHIAQEINTDIDLKRFYEMYQKYKDAPISMHSSLVPTLDFYRDHLRRLADEQGQATFNLGVQFYKFDTLDEARRELSTEKRKIEEGDPILDVIKKDLHISQAYMVYESEHWAEPDSMAHYGQGIKLLRLIVPSEFGDLIALYLAAGDEEFRKAIFASGIPARALPSAVLSVPVIRQVRDDPGFARLYNFIQERSHAFQPDVLLEAYNLYKDKMNAHPSEAPVGYSRFMLHSSSEWQYKESVDPDGETVLQADPLVNLLKNEFGINGAYKTERTKNLGNGDADRHRDLISKTVYLLVPQEVEDFIAFYLSVPSGIFHRVYYGDSAEDRRIINEVALGTHILGQGITVESWGNKEKGFFAFEKLKLPYPPGIALSSSLVQSILKAKKSSNKEEEDLYLLELSKKLSEAGLPEVKALSVRSNPVLSAPGLFETRTELNLIDEVEETSRKVDIGLSNLFDALGQVADSWESDKAKAYRRQKGVPEGYDLPVIIQDFVTGREINKWHNYDMEEKGNTYFFHRKNLSFPFYGAGVFSTRNPDTNEGPLFGQYLEYANGEQLMNRGGKGEDISGLIAAAPDVYRQLLDAGKKLESTEGPQEVEFVVNDGKVYFLQTRKLNFSPQAEAAYIKQQLAEGKISEAIAIPRIEQLQERLGARKLYRVKQGVEINVLARGEASTPGAMQGHLVWDIGKARQLMNEGKPVVFVANAGNREQVLDIIFGYPKAGLITSYGNSSSHEAVLTRSAGIPSLINLNVTQWNLAGDNQEIVLQNGEILKEDANVVVDGDKNALFASNEDVLEENGSIMDASYGINIPEFRREFVARYLDTDGKIKADITVERLEVLDRKAVSNYNLLASSINLRIYDGRRTVFIANLEKHFLHDLLTRKRESQGGHRVTRPQRVQELADFIAEVSGQDIRHMEQGDAWEELHRMGNDAFALILEHDWGDIDVQYVAADNICRRQEVRKYFNAVSQWAQRHHEMEKYGWRLKDMAPEKKDSPGSKAMTAVEQIHQELTTVISQIQEAAYQRAYTKAHQEHPDFPWEPLVYFHTDGSCAYTAPEFEAALHKELAGKDQSLKILSLKYSGGEGEQHGDNFHDFLLVSFKGYQWVVDPTWQQTLYPYTRYNNDFPKVMVVESTHLRQYLETSPIPLHYDHVWLEGIEQNQQKINDAMGGIDLTSSRMEVQVSGDNKEGIRFHLDPAMIQQLRNAPGFVPVIINIEPMTDLRGFLGIK